jgi:hypothetical protein
MTTQSKLIPWLQHLKRGVSRGSLPETDIVKHRAVVERLIKSGQNLNFVVSAAKACPSCVNIRDLQRACAEYAPQLIDDLLVLPGVDRVAVEADIIDMQHPVDVLGRLQKWYPYQDIPSEHQQRWALRLYNACQTEMKSGTVYQRRLGSDSGEGLMSALAMLGREFDDPSAATAILRAAHRVLRGLSRANTPLLHTLPDAFGDIACEAMWGYALSRPAAEVAQWRVNAQAFTLSNLSVLPNAHAWLSLYHPDEANRLTRMWQADAASIANFITMQKLQHGVQLDVVKSGGDGDLQEMTRQFKFERAPEMSTTFG